MKVKITSEYIRRVKKLCRLKLNGGNLIGGINTWAVGVVRYSAGVVDWTMEEMTSMDRRTRKILAMNGCLHTRSNVARLYLPRKEGGRGLIGIEESVRRERKSLYGYLRGETLNYKNRSKRLLWMTSKRHIFSSLSIPGLVFGHVSSIGGCHHFR